MNKNKILRNSGWWIIIILALVPVLIWIFSAPSLSLRGLGKAVGLAGFAMFALVLILSARLKFFENFFRGINESYTAHHFFGGLAFCLLLFHPLLLALSYLDSSVKEAALFFLPSLYWPKNFGSIALLLMIITLFITFYLKLKYQVWKFTHKFMGLAFIFAFLHVFLISSSVASNFLFKIYFFVLGTTAIVAYFYRTLFADYLVRVFDYTVKDIKALEDKIWEIEFEPKNRTIEFTAGQFAFFRFFSQALSKEIQPFSFSSAPGQPLKIAVKELGDYTNKIGGLKTGDSAQVEGPFGAFSFRNYPNKKQIWVAGGVGITPFLSMLRDLTAKDRDYNVDLYFSAKDDNCLAFKEEIESNAQKNQNLNVIFWPTDKNGFINANSIQKQTSDIKERDILICGPGPMMTALKKQFLEQGISKNQIHTEEFELY